MNLQECCCRCENLRLELRGGAPILAVLGLRAEHYGYTLRKALGAQGVEIDEARSIRCCAAWTSGAC